MPGIVIPPNEINLLIKLILANFNQQYQREISADTVIPEFIPGRVDTRFGFELDTNLENEFLKIRIYVQRFVVSPGIAPFRLEQVQNNPPGYGDEVYVAITDLPIGNFPVLSKAVTPVIGDLVSQLAIQTEDLTDFIQLENGEYMEVEA